MNLPKSFLQRVEKQIGKNNLSFFVEAMKHPPLESIRLHPSTEKTPHPHVLERIPWRSDGFYVSESLRNEQRVLQQTGAFSFEEASAMAVVPMLDIQINDIVLDMNATDGSKSADIASRLGSQGYIVANNVDSRRPQTVMFNIERLGLSQVIVTQHDPNHLPILFPNFFDKILLDAPSSGEGLFRQDSNSIATWSIEHIQSCAIKQKHLLDHAVQLLKPGGRIVYSTNTFSPEETEDLIKTFLQEHREFTLFNHPSQQHFDGASTGGIGVKLWPHIIKGEGYYIAVLQHNGVSPKTVKFTHRMKNPIPPAWKRFADENLINHNIQPNFALEERFFQIPISYQYHSALHTLRAGVYFGEIDKNIFYPSHHLARYLRPRDFKQTLDLTFEDPRLTRYLQGEEIHADVESGWILIAINGLSLGWGKASQGRIKNHYPKGLRLTNARK